MSDRFYLLKSILERMLLVLKSRAKIVCHSLTKDNSVDYAH